MPTHSPHDPASGTCATNTTWCMQVLAIVYGGNSTQPGAFYPKGLNGNINGTIATS